MSRKRSWLQRLKMNPSESLVRYGKQQDTAVGYNPQKSERPSRHPLACVISGTRLCSFWKPCSEGFSADVTNLTIEEAAAFQIVEPYRQRADAENVFEELKNQCGFSGFCSQKAAVSQ